MPPKRTDTPRTLSKALPFVAGVLARKVSAMLWLWTRAVWSKAARPLGL